VTSIPRFLLDECVPKTIINVVEKPLRALGANAQFTHLLTHFPIGTPDSTWVSQISKQGGWVVITGDRGKKSKVEDKLPLICRSQLVTHIMFSGGLHKKSAYYKGVAIVAKLPELLETADAVPGTGYSLSMTSKGDFRLKIAWTPPDA